MSRDDFPGAGFEALVLRLLPDRYADEILGDLIEEGRSRLSRGRSRAATRIWLLVQALRSTLALARIEWEEDAMQEATNETGGPTWGVWGPITMGLVLSLGIGLFLSAPQPWGHGILAGVTAVLLSGAGFLTWRRTGLRLLATGMLLGAAGASAFVVALFFVPGLTLEHPWVLAAEGVFVAVWLVLYFAERKTHPDRWARCKDHMRRTHPIDYFRFRHIPKLR